MAKKAKGARMVVTVECTEQKDSGVPGMSRYTTYKNKKNTPAKLELGNTASFCGATPAPRNQVVDRIECDENHRSTRWFFFVPSMNHKKTQHALEALLFLGNYRIRVAD